MTSLIQVKSGLVIKGTSFADKLLVCQQGSPLASASSSHACAGNMYDAGALLAAP